MEPEPLLLLEPPSPTGWTHHRSGPPQLRLEFPTGLAHHRSGSQSCARTAACAIGAAYSLFGLGTFTASFFLFDHLRPDQVPYATAVFLPMAAAPLCGLATVALSCPNPCPRREPAVSWDLVSGESPDTRCQDTAGGPEVSTGDFRVFGGDPEALSEVSGPETLRLPGSQGVSTSREGLSSEARTIGSVSSWNGRQVSRSHGSPGVRLLLAGVGSGNACARKEERSFLGMMAPIGADLLAFTVAVVALAVHERARGRRPGRGE